MKRIRGVKLPEMAQGERPRKKYYRSRAHCNPLSHGRREPYPAHPGAYDWTPHYPNVERPQVDFLDIGCGFGGLTVALSRLFPEKLVLAMEIRYKVCEFTRLRIESLREEHPGEYQNAAALRTNCMRYLPHFFRRAQIEKMFFCFPDPQFKAKKHRRRIVNTQLLDDYAYLLKPNGRLYTITDVLDLHTWHVDKCTQHPCFERLSDEEVAADVAAQAMQTETEEGKKVARNGGSKYYAVFRRIPDEDLAPPPLADLLFGDAPPAAAASEEVSLSSSSSSSSASSASLVAATAAATVTAATDGEGP